MRLVQAAVHAAPGDQVAVAALFGLTRDVNAALAGQVGKAGLEAALSAYRELGGEVLGLFTEGTAAGEDDGQMLDTLLELVLQARQNYRLNKQYAESDALRDRLSAVGLTIEDTKDGARWKR